MDILLTIAIIPVFLIGIYIYNKDPHKEPTKLIKNLFIRGVFSALLTLIITHILNSIVPFFAQDIDKMSNAKDIFISVFVGVALVEEFSKWIMLYTKAYNNREFDELYDMIVYSVMVSLGFACLENILYVYTYGFKVGIYRAIFAVPGHAFDAIFMGLFLTYAKRKDNSGSRGIGLFYKFLSLLVPTILHGIYDYCLVLGGDSAMTVFLAFVFILYIASFKTVKKVSMVNQNINGSINDKQSNIHSNVYTQKNSNQHIDPSMQTLINSQTINAVICPICGNSITSNYCVNCGKKRDDLV